MASMLARSAPAGLPGPRLGHFAPSHGQKPFGDLVETLRETVGVTVVAVVEAAAVAAVAAVVLHVPLEVLGPHPNSFDVQDLGALGPEVDHTCVVPFVGRPLAAPT